MNRLSYECNLVLPEISEEQGRPIQQALKKCFLLYEEQVINRMGLGDALCDRC